MYTLTDFLKFIKSVFGNYELSRSEQDVAVKCPICNKKTEKKKLVIQTIDQRVHCWVCGYKARSLIHLLKLVSTQEKQKIYLDKFYLGNKKLIDDVKELVEPIKLPDDFCLLLQCKKNNPHFLRALKHIEQRGLTIADIWRYKIGISEDIRWQNRVIIPSFDSKGQLNDFVGRTLLSNTFIKYDSLNQNKLNTIFNEFDVDWTKQLVLCEGVFDMMKCGDNVVPLLGSELNEESYLFEQIIIHSTPIALALDQDMFNTKTPKIAKKLQDFNIDVKIVKLTKSDPGTMTKDEFQEALSNAFEPNWNNMLLNKLSNLSFSLSI